MNHLESFAHAAQARGVLSRPVVLLLLLAQVVAAGCQPEPEPVPPGTNPDPTRTSAHALAEAPIDEAADADPQQPGRAYRGELTTDSLLGVLDFRYDAFVLTARESGSVTLRSEVLKAGPSAYPHGYGYPLSMGALEDGVTLGAFGGLYVQNALDSGMAVIQYPVQAGRQYILVYKTFGSFTPLTYRLRLPTALKMEGRITSLPAPVPVSGGDTGQISLENPRPATLSHIVDWLNPRVGS